MFYGNSAGSSSTNGVAAASEGLSRPGKLACDPIDWLTGEAIGSGALDTAGADGAAIGAGAAAEAAGAGATAAEEAAGAG